MFMEGGEASKKSIARFSKAIKDKKFKDLDKAMSLSEYFKAPKKVRCMQMHIKRKVSNYGRQT